MSTILRLFKLFSKKQKTKLVFIQFFIIFVAFVEVVGFSLFAPFIALIGDPSFIETNATLNRVYQFLNFSSFNSFIIFWGILTTVLIVVGNVLILLRDYLLNRLALILFRSFSVDLAMLYFTKDYIKMINRNSTQLINNFGELNRVLRSILLPFLRASGRVAMVLFFITSIIVVEPILGLVLNVGLIILYLGFIFLLKKKNQKAGGILVDINRKSHKMLSESMLGIKDVRLSHLGGTLLARYRALVTRKINAESLQMLIQVFPRYILESILFGGLTLIILYLFMAQGDNFVSIIAKLSFISLAGYKIMPGITEIYRSYMELTGATEALILVEDDLREAFEKDLVLDDKMPTPLSFEQEIKLDNIGFHYSADLPILNDVNLSLKKNQTLGIVGSTGSGKTTLANIMLGLLRPETGHYSVDGNVIDENNVENWQAVLGYVPQDIYLSDTSIRENIAFGQNEENIDEERLATAVQSACLQEHVDRLPLGLETIVGEGGIQLSGGQRQRVGIARALYRGAQVLIFDEATSALDSETEKQIMQAIHRLSHNTTMILIAHRISTLQDADNIIILEKGYIQEQGTYNYLLENSARFQDLAGSTKS